MHGIKHFILVMSFGLQPPQMNIAYIQKVPDSECIYLLYSAGRLAVGGCLAALDLCDEVWDSSSLSQSTAVSHIRDAIAGCLFGISWLAEREIRDDVLLEEPEDGEYSEEKEAVEVTKPLKHFWLLQGQIAFQL